MNDLDRVLREREALERQLAANVFPVINALGPQIALANQLAKDRALMNSIRQASALWATVDVARIGQVPSNLALVDTVSLAAAVRLRQSAVADLVRSVEALDIWSVRDRGWNTAVKAMEATSVAARASWAALDAGVLQYYADVAAAEELNGEAADPVAIVAAIHASIEVNLPALDEEPDQERIRVAYQWLLWAVACAIYGQLVAAKLITGGGLEAELVAAELAPALVVAWQLAITVREGRPRK